MGSVARHEYNFLSTIEQTIMNATGLHEVSQGAMMPGDMTAQEVAVMRDSDQTRVRKAQRNLMWSLNRIAKQVLFNWAQWPDFDWLVNVAVDPSKPIPGVGSPQAGVPFDPKQLFQGDKLTNLLKYKLRFIEGSTLPPNLDATKAQAWQLFQAGIYDEEDLLQALQVPNAQQVAQKAMGRKSQAAAMPPAGPPDAAGGPMPPEAGQEGAPEQAFGGGPQMPPPDMGQMMPPQGAMPPQGLPPDLMAQLQQMPPDQLMQLVQSGQLPPEVLQQLGIGAPA